MEGHMMDWMDKYGTRLNKGWSEQLDAKLLFAVIQEERRIRQNNEDDLDWDRIGSSIPGKSAVQCLQRYIDIESDDKERPAKRRKSNSSETIIDSSSWNKEEDDLLRKLVDLNPGGAQFWNKVATHFIGHDAINCFARWHNMNNTLVTDPLVTNPLVTNPLVTPPDLKGEEVWAPEEDQIIREKVRLYGGKWTKIAQFLPGRSGKQVRLRYRDKLDPKLKKGNWTDDEEATLIALHQEHGNCWSIIAKEMPWRSYNDIRNRLINNVQRKFEKHGKEKVINAALLQVQMMQRMGRMPIQRQQESKPPPRDDRPYAKYMHNNNKDLPYSKYMHDPSLPEVAPHDKLSAAAHHNDQPYQKEEERTYGDSECDDDDEEDEDEEESNGGENYHQEPALHQKVSAAAHYNHQAYRKEDRACGDNERHDQEEEKPKGGINREKQSPHDKQFTAAHHNYQPNKNEGERAYDDKKGHDQEVEEQEKEKLKVGEI